MAGNSKIDIKPERFIFGHNIFPLLLITTIIIIIDIEVIELLLLQLANLELKQLSEEHSNKNPCGWNCPDLLKQSGSRARPPVSRNSPPKGKLSDGVRRRLEN